ncbi:hypothetical protein ACP275_01G092500 [Erythranthe tilingii]
MAPTNADASAVVEYSSSGASSDELAAKAVHKRFEGLVLVRTKAIKGKGAWYWAHLEPVLVHNPDTGLPKSVKLRCSFCAAVFSASNPSRTASEHLKKGTCPSFTSAPKPISSVPSPSSISPATTTTASPSPQPPHNHRKRSSGSRAGGANPVAAAVPPLAIVDPSRFTVDLSYPPAVSIASTSSASASAAAAGGGGGLYGRHPHHQHHHHHHHKHQQQQLVLSGGKEDLGALAMLEDSVKRLKSPKSSPLAPALNKAQADSALDFLADWVYECCGSSASFSTLDHPKFKAFLHQIGLPSISRKEIAGPRLDTRYEEAKAESEAKIREAMFFQIAADGWKPNTSAGPAGDENNLVHVAVNLPNGTHVYRRAVFTTGDYVPPKYAEEILWETITDICGESVHQCVGIVSDRFKSTALRNLENQHRWMVNISCQYKGFNSLVNDFGKDLPCFKNAAANCLKLANFINNNSPIRRSFHKYQTQEYGHATLLKTPLLGYKRSDFDPVYTMLDDVLNSARALHLLISDESYKTALTEEPIAREIEEMMRDPHFWNELEAVHSLVKLIRAMAEEIEAEKPRVGQCLPLWEELRLKVKEWCSKFHVPFGHVEKVFDKRLERNYHPSWAAAFILDPFYLIKDASGKYLPPFKCLTHEQEKDVDKLVTRLVSKEEAHIAVMELMKWRTEGLDPVYARAVQLKERDSITGKMRIANPQSSRLVWETYLNEFKVLGKVAVRLIFLQATSCGLKRSNWGLRKWASADSRSRAQKLIFISACSKMEKREFCSNGEDGDDVELFGLENGDDDVMNDVFVDTP